MNSIRVRYVIQGQDFFFGAWFLVLVIWSLSLKIELCNGNYAFEGSLLLLCGALMAYAMDFLGIIPARYGSSRLKGKALADICGKTMIRRVYEQASRSIGDLYVATDDNRIAKEVESFGGRV
ncbi:MAG TPA: hypothetical protein VI583_00520, partial [Cyclobacteriaceae bacterium]|nr:hypothetical protein [Cyclobacteriaceae bacterium]